MIVQQQKLLLSPYIDIYELVIPKDNILRQIKELVDFEFIYTELIDKYCLDNGRNAISPIRMFKYLLLKAIGFLVILITTYPLQKNISGKYNRSVADHGIITATLEFSAQFHKRFRCFEKTFDGPSKVTNIFCNSGGVYALPL